MEAQICLWGLVDPEMNHLHFGNSLQQRCYDLKHQNPCQVLSLCSRPKPVVQLQQELFEGEKLRSVQKFNFQLRLPNFVAPSC